ncbi:MAG: hypothetical protein GX213_14030 [Clostridiaceae bacterium]|nr:hypothetical protein [Clostridiaceae bacterium]
MKANRIGHFFIYFKRMMKFHDLKAKGVPQVIFVLLLAISFGFIIAIKPVIMDYTIYLQQFYNTYMDILSSGSNSDPSAFFGSILELQNSNLFSQLMSVSMKILGVVTLQQILLMLLSFFYLGAYLCDLESEGSSLSCYIRKFTKALPRFIGFNLIFYLAVIIIFAVGLFLLAMASVVLPVLYLALSFITFLLPAGWFIIQVIFIFKDITFLDTGVSIWRNFRLSMQLSAGNRMIIAKNIFFIVFLNFLIRMFTVESQLVSLFIISFLEVIILLIKQRLIALMYLSRTRRIKEPPIAD